MTNNKHKRIRLAKTLIVSVGVLLFGVLASGREHQPRTVYVKPGDKKIAPMPMNPETDYDGYLDIRPPAEN